jgi:hypothetical protein
MNGWAKERLAPTIAAIVMLLLATPSLACDTTTGCPAGSANTDNLPANMLPTYAEAKPQTQAAAAPVNLKKFTKKRTRSAQRASSRKALASKARGSKARGSRTLTSKASRTEPAKIAQALANANAELTEADAATAPADQAAPDDTPTPAAATEPAAQGGDAPAQEANVVAAEDFNDVDRTAWENPGPPRLMQFTALDSHAELRADDSKWTHTSTVGKIFVALGALLTIGSAIRMLIA